MSMDWMQGEMSLTKFTELPLEPLPKISASRYLSLKQCPLKEIWASSRQPLLPCNPAAYLGTAIHRMLELVFQGRISNMDELSYLWDNEIERLEKEMLENPVEKLFVSLRMSILNFEVKKLLAFKMIKPLLKKSPQRNNSGLKRSTEAWVRTANGKVVGKIDLVKELNSEIEIIDYKTGPLTAGSTSGSAKEEYLLQVKIYAALYHAMHGKWPVRLTLVGINQETITIDVDSEECAKLLQEAVKNLDDINELIEAGLKPEDFAQPSPEACKYCLFRPACSKYWGVRSEDGNWPTDARGIITSKTELENGLFRVVVNTIAGEIAIRGLSPERHSFLKDDIESIVFCNLWNDKADGFFVEKMFTISYAL